MQLLPVSSSKTFSSQFHNNFIIPPRKKTENPYLLRSHSSFYPTFNPWKPPICSLSLFWIFHINGIIQYVTSSVWFLSLGMFLRFIHMATCISTSLLLMVQYYEIICVYHILFIHSCTLQSFPPFDYYK